MSEPESRSRSTPADEFLTLEELRQVLRLGKSAANELARANALPIPAIRAGRQYRFSRRALDEMLARQHDSRPDGQS